MDEKQFKSVGKEVVNQELTELAQVFGIAMMSEGTSRERATELLQMASTIYSEMSTILFEKVKSLDFYDRTRVAYVAARLLTAEIKTSGLVSMGMDP